MHTFIVRTLVEGSEYDETLDADYYVHEDGLLTFKDSAHKQVASFAGRHIVSVKREGRATTIGSVTVSVIPQLDEAAMSKLVREVADSVKARAGAAT